MTAGPPAPPPPAGPPGPFWGFPRPRKRTLIVIGGLVAAVLIAAAILAIIVSSIQDDRQTRTSDSAPELGFVKFEMEKQEIRVGEATSILFNVQNSEDRVIDDARVVVTIQPDVGKTYLSISNSTVELPALNTNARTGDIEVMITATGTPAREAVYLIKGTLYAGEAAADAREFELTIRQP